MLNLIVKQMQCKGFQIAAQHLQQKWNSLNLYEKRKLTGIGTLNGQTTI